MKIKSLLVLSLVLAIGCLAIMPAFAATDNPSPVSPGFSPMVIPIMGNNTSVRLNKVIWKAPVGYKIIHASAVARTVSGTSPTLKIRGKNGALVNYSGSIGQTTTPTDLKLAPATAVAGSGPNMADEGLQSVDLIIGGTTPVWSDVTLFLFLKRK